MYFNNLKFKNVNLSEYQMPVILPSACALHRTNNNTYFSQFESVKKNIGIQ